jgi:hypothetical protein
VCLSRQYNYHQWSGLKMMGHCYSGSLTTAASIFNKAKDNN